MTREEVTERWNGFTIPPRPFLNLSRIRKSNNINLFCGIPRTLGAFRFLLGSPFGVSRSPRSQQHRLLECKSLCLLWWRIREAKVPATRVITVRRRLWLLKFIDLSPSAFLLPPVSVFLVCHSLSPFSRSPLVSFLPPYSLHPVMYDRLSFSSFSSIFSMERWKIESSPSFLPFVLVAHDPVNRVQRWFLVKITVRPLCFFWTTPPSGRRSFRKDFLLGDARVERESCSSARRNFGRKTDGRWRDT